MREKEREGKNRNKRNKLEGRIKAEGNKHLIQHHSSSSCLFTPSPNSIWLLPPLDSTALHTPYPMCAHSTGHLYYFLFTPCSRFHPFAPSLHLSYSTRLIPSFSFLCRCLFSFSFFFFHFALPVSSLFFFFHFFLSPSLFFSQRVKERGPRVVLRSVVLLFPFRFDPATRWFSVYFPLIHLHLIYPGCRAPLSEGWRLDYRGRDRWKVTREANATSDDVILNFTSE